LNKNPEKIIADFQVDDLKIFVKLIADMMVKNYLDRKTSKIQAY